MSSDLPQFNHEQSRRLFHIGIVALALAIAYFGFTAGIDDPLRVMTGLGVIVLASIPSLNWARLNRTHFPVFEVFTLTFIPFYALPILNEHEAVRDFPEFVIEQAGLSVVLFLLALLAGHAVPGGGAAHNSALRESILPENRLHWLSYGMLANSIYLYVAQFTEMIPFEFAGLSRAAFTGIGIVSTFVLARLWGEGRLSAAGKSAFIVNLLLQAGILLTNIYLIRVMSIMILAFVGYVSTARRIPVVSMALCFFVIGVLHNGKDRMRDLYWFEEDRQIGFADMPSFFQEWFQTGLTQQRADDVDPARGILDRSSLLHILCLVIDRHPDFNPFYYGETYKSIPFVIVPRFLWSDKPPPHQSNIMLSIDLGLVSEDDPMRVSIAFGTLSESYANFGFIGPVVLGLLLGQLFRRAVRFAASSAILSLPGLFLIILVAWSFQVEMTLSVWISSLLQASVAVLGGAWLFRTLVSR